MRRGERRRRRLALLVLPLAMLASGGLVYDASTSAFTATTDDGTNNWATGSITLSDDDSGSAMFNATGLVPNSTGSRCIVVSYTGAVAASVALYGTGSGTLAPYLDLTVETGTGGTFGGGDPCTGFSASATVFSGTLSSFLSTHTDFASGAPTTSRWSPSSTGSRVYRFTYTVADDNNAQGKSASASFTWEARSS